MWPSQLGDLNITSSPIEWHQEPYRLNLHHTRGTQNPGVEQSEISRQIAASVIEPAQSALASPFFSLKRTARSNFSSPTRSLAKLRVMNITKSQEWKSVSTRPDAPKCSSLSMPFWNIEKLQSNQNNYIKPHSRYMWVHAYVLEFYQVSPIPQKLHNKRWIVFYPDYTGKRVWDLSLKISKCTFFSDTVENRGNIIRPETQEAIPCSHIFCTRLSSNMWIAQRCIGW